MGPELGKHSSVNSRRVDSSLLRSLHYYWQYLKSQQKRIPENTTYHYRLSLLWALNLGPNGVCECGSWLNRAKIFRQSQNSGYRPGRCLHSALNPLRPNSDENEISLYITTTCSKIHVMRIKKVITKDEVSWC